MRTSHKDNGAVGRPTEEHQDSEKHDAGETNCGQGFGADGGYKIGVHNAHQRLRNVLQHKRTGQHGNLPGETGPLLYS